MSNATGHKITVLPNGPLKVENVDTVQDGTGKAFDTKGKTEVYLCRCGHSANKPFCDGSHTRNGFKG